MDFPASTDEDSYFKELVHYIMIPSLLCERKISRHMVFTEQRHRILDKGDIRAKATYQLKKGQTFFNDRT